MQLRLELMTNIHEKLKHSLLNVPEGIYFIIPVERRSDVSKIMRVGPIVVYDPIDFTPHLRAFSIFMLTKESVNRTFDTP